MELTELNNMELNPKVSLEKGVVSFQLMTPESKKCLDDNGIKMSKATDFYIGAYDAEELLKRITIAREKGFLDAYIESPRRLMVNAELAATRISELEALGIPYRSPEGKYIASLFGRKTEFNQLVSSVHEKARVETPNVHNEVVEHADETMSEAKSVAMHVLEQFAMENLKDDIFSAIDNSEDKSLDVKSVILEAFKKCGVGGNVDLLSNTIDEILKNMSEQNVLGRVA